MNENDSLIQTLCNLIRIPSCSHADGGEESAAQAYVEARMREAGARVTTFDAADVEGFLQHPLCCGPQRNYRNRPTVLGEIGPADAPALLVLAHSDTVSINNEPELWKVTRPFEPRVHEGRVYGRGAGDDKWGVATLIQLILEFAPLRERLAKRVIFASTIDEENGVGNGLLLLHLAGIKAQKALYLDGCNKVPAAGNLGGSNLYLRPAQSISNETLAADELKLRSACDRLSQTRAGLFDQPMLAGSYIRDQSAAIRRDADHRGAPFLLLYFYTVPGEDGAALQNQLERMIRDEVGDRYTISCRMPWFEATALAPDHPWINEFTDAFRTATGLATEAIISAKQDSFVLRKYADIPTISFGVSRSSGPGALHTPDEFITLEDSNLGWQVAKQVVTDWLSPIKS